MLGLLYATVFEFLELLKLDLFVLEKVSSLLVWYLFCGREVSLITVLSSFSIDNDYWIANFLNIRVFLFVCIRLFLIQCWLRAWFIFLRRESIVRIWTWSCYYFIHFSILCLQLDLFLPLLEELKLWLIKLLLFVKRKKSFLLILISHLISFWSRAEPFDLVVVIFYED